MCRYGCYEGAANPKEFMAFDSPTTVPQTHRYRGEQSKNYRKYPESRKAARAVR